MSDISAQKTAAVPAVTMYTYSGTGTRFSLQKRRNGKNYLVLWKGFRILPDYVHIFKEDGILSRIKYFFLHTFYKKNWVEVELESIEDEHVKIKILIDESDMKARPPGTGTIGRIKAVFCGVFFAHRCLQ